MGHMGDAWDVAHAILFLASDEARVYHRRGARRYGGDSAATP